MLTRLSLLSVVLLATAVLSAQTPAPAPAPVPGRTVTPIFENGTLSAAKLTFAPGSREQPHTHPYPLLVIITSRGELEMANGGAPVKGAKVPGDFEFVPTGVTHAAANVGNAPLEAIALNLKVDRVKGGTAPAPQALPGLTRTPVTSNDELAITRLEFQPGVREPVHTHPYDLVVVPISAGTLDLQLGDKKSNYNAPVGQALFIPRGVPHAVANTGNAPLRLLGVAIK